MREDQVRQGLNFLRTQVGGSQTLSERIGFLEGKGLTSVEIAEALQRLSLKRGGALPSSASSRWHWLLSYMIAPLAVIGTGLLVYNLTGGEEEFPKPAEEGEGEGREQQAALLLHSGGVPPPQPQPQPQSFEGGSTTSNNSLLLFPQEVLDPQEQPDWAKELQRMTMQLTQEVQIIKAKLNELTVHSSSSSPATADGDDVTENVKAPEPITLESRQCSIREAVCAMQETSKSGDVVKKCSSALIMYIKMLLEQPDVPRYRKISVSNESFKTHVQPVEGHDKVLESVGFERRGLYYEWSWVTSASQPPASSSSSTTATTASPPPDKETRTLLLQLLLAHLERVKADGHSAVHPELNLSTGDNPAAHQVEENPPGSPIVAAKGEPSFSFQDIANRVRRTSAKEDAKEEAKEDDGKEEDEKKESEIETQSL